MRRDLKERFSIVNKILKHDSSTIETKERFYYVNCTTKTINTKIKEGFKGRISKKVYKNKTSLESRLKELMRMNVESVSHSLNKTTESTQETLFPDEKRNKTKDTKTEVEILTELRGNITEKIIELNDDLMKINDRIDTLLSSDKFDINELREKYKK